jgi:SAM-dependent methyltransferase
MATDLTSLFAQFERKHYAKTSVKCSDQEKKRMESADINQLYGELDFAQTALLFEKLRVAEASRFYDLGCGLGKLCFFVFIHFKNIHTVLGIEYSSERCDIGKAVIQRFAESNSDYYNCQVKGKKVILSENKTSRTLTIEEGDGLLCRPDPQNACYHLNVAFYPSRKKEQEELIESFLPNTYFSTYEGNSPIVDMARQRGYIDLKTIHYLALFQKI